MLQSPPGPGGEAGQQLTREVACPGRVDAPPDAQKGVLDRGAGEPSTVGLPQVEGSNRDPAAAWMEVDKTDTKTLHVGHDTTVGEAIVDLPVSVRVPCVVKQHEVARPRRREAQLQTPAGGVFGHRWTKAGAQHGERGNQAGASENPTTQPFAARCDAGSRHPCAPGLWFGPGLSAPPARPTGGRILLPDIEQRLAETIGDRLAPGLAPTALQQQGSQQQATRPHRTASCHRPWHRCEFLAWCTG